MADIDVLATLPKTRREILVRIKQRVGATIVELSRDLRMTHEGVRSHIVELQADGWVTPDCEVDDGVGGEPASGRPPVRYCLSVAGEHVFPKRYDGLTALLLDAVVRTSGAEGLEELLANITDIRVEELRARRSSSVQRLEHIYLRNDPFIETTTRDGDTVIVERNCPFLQVALEEPAVCSTTVSVMRRIAGCEVVRERRFQDGEGRCEFRLLAGRPLKRPPRFAFEPPKDAAGR